jgi:hypothetical protein
VAIVPVWVRVETMVAFDECCVDTRERNAGIFGENTARECCVKFLMRRTADVFSNKGRQVLRSVELLWTVGGGLRTGKCCDGFEIQLTG